MRKTTITNNKTRTIIMIYCKKNYVNGFVLIIKSNKGT